ncbi:unnamed protein product, partial [Staurois parvus]
MRVLPQLSSLRDCTADWSLGQQVAAYPWAGVSDSSSSPGTQQRMASRDTQPRTVCGLSQQQLSGHLAADSFQGHAATDNVRGPSAAALRTLSSGQGAGVLSRQACRLAGSDLWGLTLEEGGSCRAAETPT